MLVHFDGTRAYERLEVLGGLKAGDVFAALWPTGLMRRFMCGEIESANFIREVSELCQIRFNEKEFSDIWTSIFSRETLVPESLVQSLAARYRTVLLSNIDPLQFAMLDMEYPILRHFHSRVLSYQVGWLKPDPQIYRRAVEEAGCLPEECFFADDAPTFVQAARDVGIDAVQFISAAQLESDLRQRGVTFD